MLKICLLVVALVVASLPDAFAWGVKGHAAIADLASRALTPAAQAQVAVLLAEDLDRDGAPSGRTRLAEIASWADEIRDIAEPDQYRGWHSRPNPVCATKLAKCRNGACVDQLILHFAAVLADRQQTRLARNEALKWLVHLVGDLHQPLHVGVGPDRGKQRVTLGEAEAAHRRTLHQVWDRELAVMALASSPLRLPDRLPRYTPEAVADWMEEARDVSRTAVYAALPGAGCGSRGPARGQDDAWVLDAAYQSQAIQVIHLQLERAAARLAALLNATLQ